jgi:hypothetical protein
MPSRSFLIRVTLRHHRRLPSFSDDHGLKAVAEDRDHHIAVEPVSDPHENRRYNQFVADRSVSDLFLLHSKGRTTNLQRFKLRLGSETKDAGGRLRNISHLTTGDLRESPHPVGIRRTEGTTVYGSVPDGGEEQLPTALMGLPLSRRRFQVLPERSPKL